MNRCDYRTVAYVDLGAVKRNFRLLQGGGERGVWAVVKANAYGHGAQAVARTLQDQARGFAVATAEEGAELRQCGVEKPVLVLGDVPPASMDVLFAANLTPTVFSVENGRLLAAEARRRGVELGVHAAIDTGMRRIGFAPTPEGIDELAALVAEGALKPVGVFSHFATADDESSAFYLQQLERFRYAVRLCRTRMGDVGCVHLCNSAAAIRADDPYGDIRAGLLLYGVSPIEGEAARFRFLPALKWVAKIVQIKHVEAGESVGYGRAFVAPAPMRIATLSVGYADGYPRALSGRGRTLVGGEVAPVLGRVCMDMTMVDVTRCPAAEVGGEAVLIGRQGERQIGATELAKAADTIAYELLAGISPRVKRIYAADTGYDC